MISPRSNLVVQLAQGPIAGIKPPITSAVAAAQTGLDILRNKTGEDYAKTAAIKEFGRACRICIALDDMKVTDWSRRDNKPSGNASGHIGWELPKSIA